MAYAAISNGGTLWEPRIGAAVVSPDGSVVKRIEPEVASRIDVPPEVLRYIDTALLGTAKVGTMAWKMGGFPLGKVQIRSKTGTAEVYGKQTTSWVASYDKQYVVIMQISQGGTGSGTSGDAIRHIWESLYGIHGLKVDEAKGAQPGAAPPTSLPVFHANGTISPAAGRALMVTTATATTTRSSRRVNVTESRSMWRRLDWVLIGCTGALLVLGTLLVWSSTSHNVALTGGDSTVFVTKHLTNIVIGIGLAIIVASTDHRWVRIWTPVVYLGAIFGLLLVLSPFGSVINGSRSWIVIGGMSIQPAELAKLGVITGMALLLAERIEAARSKDKRRRSAARHRRARSAGDRRRAGRAHHGAARPRDDAGARGDGGRPDRDRGGPEALAGRAVRRWRPAVCCAAVQLGVLKGYQLLRFESFYNPALDPQGAGYNTIQARIAIGNGGLFGQGLFHGSQTQSGFVPEQHTDFIFTVAGEELGLVGSAAIVGALRGAAVAGDPHHRPRPTTPSAGWPAPGSSAGSASRPSRTSACASASCRSPGSRCR